MRRVVQDLGAYRPHLRGPGSGVWRWDDRLELRGKPGVLRVGFWGVGSAFSNYLGQSNIVVCKGETVVFIDLGSKTTQRLAEFGLSVHDIDNITLTHSHADHIGSLEELGLKRRYEAPIVTALKEGHRFEDGGVIKRADQLREAGSLRTPLWVHQAYAHELWSQSLSGGMAHSELVNGARVPMALDAFFNLCPPTPVTDDLGRPAWSFEVGEGIDRIHFLMYQTPHVPSDADSLEDAFWSCGFCIDDRVIYSGDTQFDPWIFDTFGDRVETLFHDCQSFPGGVHAWYGELAKLPTSIKRKMLLYHTDDGMRPLEEHGVGQRDVAIDDFQGFAEALPVFYEWD